MADQVTAINERVIAAGGFIDKLLAEIGRTIVGQSPAMDRVRRMVEICARSDANVLLCGETGVGKDLIASTATGMLP